jgi:hypothetical protein
MPSNTPSPAYYSKANTLGWQVTTSPHTYSTAQIIGTTAPQTRVPRPLLGQWSVSLRQLWQHTANVSWSFERRAHNLCKPTTSPRLTQTTTYIPIPPMLAQKTKLSKQITIIDQDSVFRRYILQKKAMSNPTTSNSGPGIGGQALLKRRIGTSIEAFRNHYINRHAPIAIPWCLSNGVTYYAQVSERTLITNFRT